MEEENVCICGFERGFNKNCSYCNQYAELQTLGV